MWARFFLAALLLIGPAHAQNIATNPIFSVVNSTAPALDIDFMTGTLDPRVVFSRASNRSCTNSSGTLVNAPHNLLTNSVLAGGTAGTYNAGGIVPTGWGLPQSINSASGVGNMTTLAYGTENGTPYVDLGVTIATALGASAPVLLLAPSIVPVVGLTYTTAWDIRLVSGSLLAGMTNTLINWWQSVSQPLTSLSGITGTITRYTQTSVVPAATTAGAPGIQMSVPAGVTGAFVMRISRPQLEQNAAASTYIPTTTTALYGPCLDYDPGTLAAKGLLVEAASTNQVFPSVNWVANATASGSVDGAVQNAATAPGGTTTAEKLIPGSFSGVHQFFRAWVGAINTTYTASVYVKAAGWNYVNFYLGNTSFAVDQNVQFNLSNGTISSQSANSTGTIQALAGGWYRISVQNTSLGTTGNYVVSIIPQPTATFNITQTGDAVSGTLVWGEQVEAGFAPTSYIATTTAVVTRAADVAYVNVDGFKGINGNTGSLFGRMIYEAPNPNASGTYARWLAFNDGINPNAGTEWGAGQSLTYPSYFSPVLENQALSIGFGSYGPYSAGASIRFTMTFNATRADAAINANTSLNNLITPTVIPRSITVLNLSQPQRYQNPASLWFQRVTYYPAYLGPIWATGKANGTIP